MSKWQSTPFETLEGAHVAATKFNLNPSSIIDTGQGFRSFQTKTGRQRTILAQRVEGGPVLEKRLPKGKKSKIPLQDPNAPKFGEEDRLLTGPWTDSAYHTLDEVRAHYSALGTSTKHGLAFEGECLVIHYPDGDVAEYRLSPGHMVQSRMLFSAKGRYLKSYNKAEFLGSPWEQSGHQDLEAVEEYWRKQFVNFDNVEVLTAIVYRIGQDEYEYSVDKNTDKVWTRKLSCAKEAA